jgi:DNA-binding response OmpR family regulator
MPKILVVDDDKNIRNLVSLYLTTASYDVETAIDGEEGLKKFDGSSFDAVITDFEMPKFNGDEIARYVRNTGKNIPVICITGTSLDIDHSCFDIVINKPFSFKELNKGLKFVSKSDESDLGSCKTLQKDISVS